MSPLTSHQPFGDLQRWLQEAQAGSGEALEKMLDRLRGSKLTYVDASSLCFMDRHRIRKVWSTDHHLGLTGAEVLPRG